MIPISSSRKRPHSRVAPTPPGPAKEPVASTSRQSMEDDNNENIHIQNQADDHSARHAAAAMLSELDGLVNLDWDSWNGQDDTIVQHDSDSSSDSGGSFNSALTHISTNGNAPKRPNNGKGSRKYYDSQKRNMHRVIRKEVDSRNLVIYQVKKLETEQILTLQLQDMWSQQKLEEDCLINIVDVELDSNYTYKLSRDGGFVVVEPDQLVSVSQIIRQLWCAREPLISERVHRPFDDNVDTLRGVICHELMQTAMLNNLKCARTIRTHLLDILRRPAIVHRAYALKFDQKGLETLGVELINFVYRFMVKRFFGKGTNQSWQINKVHDIEDNYWNPRFGIKGKVDATIEVKKLDGTRVIIPFEIKTGNPNLEGKQKIRDDHVGQVTLYSLLMNPRHKDVKEGLLYYVREDFWKECEMKSNNLQALVMLRNDLVQNTPSKFGKLVNLPKAEVDFDRKCVNCSQKDPCSLFLRKEFDNDLDRVANKTESHLLNATPHLNAGELEFFHKWFTFLTLEIEASEKTKLHPKTLWTVPPEERTISCLRSLILITCQEKVETGTLSFEALFHAEDASAVANFSSLNFKKGDVLILGTEDEVCVSYCVVEATTVDPFTITVSLDSQLYGKGKSRLYTLDRVTQSNPGTINYYYLAELMEKSPQMTRLRDYIILKKQPIFKPISKKDLEDLKDLLVKYNSNQQRVLMKASSTDSFLFVKGMPGTGKTETIVGLIQSLVRRMKTVLVVGYTSTAVDNIILKYKSFSTNFVRLGKEGYMKTELKPFAISNFTKGCDDVDELRKKLNEPPVVVTTLLSLGHEIFANRTFDYAIIDEVSQALPISCIGALGLANKYVLFGDPEQLPPVIISGAAKALGCEETLFTVMATPANTVKLTAQYRMNGVIMKLANKLTYNNQMTCFSEQLERAYLNLPTNTVTDYLRTLTVKARQRWLSYIASKKLARSVVFLDTSSVNAHDSFENNSIKNSTEALLVLDCLKVFIRGGLDVNEIGLIAPYRSQVNALRRKCEELNDSFLGIKEVEVNTVDQYQGRDKTVIICSFTKSRPIGFGVGQLIVENAECDAKSSILDDKRRLNVVITRAKRKLVMVGHVDYLKTFAPFKALFEVLEPNQIIHLQPGDMEGLDPSLPLQVPSNNGVTSSSSEDKYE